MQAYTVQFHANVLTEYAGSYQLLYLHLTNHYLMFHLRLEFQQFAYLIMFLKQKK